MRYTLVEVWYIVRSSVHPNSIEGFKERAVWECYFCWPLRESWHAHDPLRGTRRFENSRPCEVSQRFVNSDLRRKTRLTIYRGSWWERSFRNDAQSIRRHTTYRDCRYARAWNAYRALKRRPRAPLGASTSADVAARWKSMPLWWRSERRGRRCRLQWPRPDWCTSPSSTICPRSRWKRCPSSRRWRSVTYRHARSQTCP